MSTAQPDTIYVYEDVVVYDTVVIYDTVFIKDNNDISRLKPKRISLLQLDTIKQQANLLLISGRQTTTIPINHIILDENFSKNIKNSESMKKISFFGIVCFAFQSIVLAQTNYEVSIGSGIWWENGNLKYVDRPYSPLINTGVYAKRNFGEKKLGLKTGIEYCYLFSYDSYKFDGTVGVWYSIEGYEFEDLNTHYSFGLHDISIPILLYYNKYKIQPFVGLNYNYLFTGVQKNSSGTKSFSDSHNIGINVGMGYSATDNISINLEYKHNLTSDYGEAIYGSVDGQSTTDNSWYLWNNQLLISLSYRLGKRNVEAP